MTNGLNRFPVTCDVDRVTYHGNYWVAGKILVISTARGGTSTQLAARNPERLAISLLKKLARGGKALPI